MVRCVRAGAGVVLVLLSSAAALGGAQHASPARAQTVVEVDMVNNQFGPATVTIAAGDAVLWVNAEDPALGDNGDHDVVDAATGQELSPDLLAPGQSFTFEFDTPGVFNYLCDVHQNMYGTVTVE